MKFSNCFWFCLVFNYIFFHNGCTLIKWSRVGESNSFDQLGRLGHNQYANPALVRKEGLEPSIHKAQDFKSCVYTNSTTLACYYYIVFCNYCQQFWWARRDSNSHAFRQWLLRPSWLPLHHQPFTRLVPSRSDLLDILLVLSIRN